MNRTVRRGGLWWSEKILCGVSSHLGTLLCFTSTICGIYIFLCLFIRSKFSSSSLVDFRVENILMCCQLRVKFKFKHQRGNQSYSRSSLCVADFISRCLWAGIKKYSSWICESRHLSGYNIRFDFSGFVSVLCWIYLSHGIKNVLNAPLLLLW